MLERQKLQMMEQMKLEKEKQMAELQKQIDKEKIQKDSEMAV